MKKLLTITGIFNDVFTNYKDKESSVSMIVDDEIDCKCTTGKNCWMHRDPSKYILTDIKDKNEDDLQEGQ